MEWDIPGQSGTGSPVVPLSRTKKIPCAASLLSWDKKILVLLSLCRRTRAAEKIPGQTPLSRDVLGQKMSEKVIRFKEI